MNFKQKTIVEPGTQKLAHLETELEQGLIKIPQFQRDFVWGEVKAAALIDSVVKGFPIGSFIYWKTDERLREVRNLGRVIFPEATPGERVNYVLDGQQRLTSLVAALLGLEVELKDKKKLDFSKLQVILGQENVEDAIVVTEIPEGNTFTTIPLKEIWARNGPAYDSCTGADKEFRDHVSLKLMTYEVPKTTLLNADLTQATEVFSRINTGGQDLSVFEIMVAKTYSPDDNFDLVDKSDEIMAEIQTTGFGTIEPINIVQLISIMLSGECKKSNILSLAKKDFITAWPLAINAIKRSIDFIKDDLGIPASRLLPYSALIVPISFIFTKLEKKRLTVKQKRHLKDFFWRAGWSSRYSSGADSKLSKDCKDLLLILQKKSPRFEWSDSIVAENLKDEWFSAGNAFSKTIIALLASLKPEKYDVGGLVNVRNDGLLRANSVNFHHVFPKAFLKKKGFEYWQVNQIANISLVDEFLNKNIIRAKKPSKYFSDFEDGNDDLERIMQTHLIDVYYEGESDCAAVWTDNYVGFIDERVDAIINELKSRVIEAS